VLFRSSPFSRLMGLYIPRFQVHGPADFPRIMQTILWSCVLELLIIAFIWWRFRDRAKPFLVTGVLIIVEMAALVFASDFPALRQVDIFIGHTPGPAIWAMGFIIGALTSWSGWEAGKSRIARVEAVQPA